MARGSARSTTETDEAFKHNDVARRNIPKTELQSFFEVGKRSTAWS